MLSYSQNFEDVYLHRAFADVSSGFYIDLGAFHPVLDSVTKHFYDAGWCGINVDAGPGADSFLERARDINLKLAIGATEGEITYFYDPISPGVSSTTPARGAEMSAASDLVRQSSVKMVTLETLWDSYCPGQHVHFLKLDIEGAEWDVLRSTDWSRYRPELIVAECTRPCTNERLDDGWLEHMLAVGYSEVFFDGLNVYYIAEESARRRGAFNCPVNVLDCFSKYTPPPPPAPPPLSPAPELQIVRSVEPAHLATEDLARGLARLEQEVRRQYEHLKRRDKRQDVFVQALRRLANQITTQTGEVHRSAVADPMALVSHVGELIHEALARARTASDDSMKREAVNRAAVACAVSRLQHLTDWNDWNEEPGAFILLLTEKLEEALRQRAELHVIVGELEPQARRSAAFEQEAAILRRRLDTNRRMREKALELAISTANGRVDELKRMLKGAEGRSARLDMVERELTGLRIAFAEVEERARAKGVELGVQISLRESIQRRLGELEGELLSPFQLPDATDDVPCRKQVASFGWRALVARALVRRAERFEKREAWAAAAALYGQAQRTCPHDKILALKEGNMLQKAGAFVRAENCYRRAIEIDLESVTAFEQLGQLHDAAQRPWHAYAAYAHAERLRQRLATLGGVSPCV